MTGEGEVPGSGEYGINANLGDPAGNLVQLGSSFYGSSYVLGAGGSGNLCAGGTHTWVGGDNEVLEGTKKWDVLSGNDAANTIWGRQGNDTLFGHGGNDIVEGHAGNDVVWGEEGVDSLFGNAGNDKLRARDTLRDATVNCGDDVDEPTQKDAVDPLVGCE